MSAEAAKHQKTIASGDRTILPEGAKMIPVYVMGKKYMLPETLTIQKAIEYAGYQFIRACGCRGGICGACPTVWRVQGDYQLHFGLACQTVIEENMVLAQLPFFPANKALYDVEELSQIGDAVGMPLPRGDEVRGLQHLHPGLPHGDRRHGATSTRPCGATWPGPRRSPSTASSAACARPAARPRSPTTTWPSCAAGSTAATSLPRAEHLGSRVEQILSGRTTDSGRPHADVRGRTAQALRGPGARAPGLRRVGAAGQDVSVSCQRPSCQRSAETMNSNLEGLADS